MKTAAAFVVALLAIKQCSASNCSRIIESSGVTTNFYQNIAHGIHSITVDDLQNYFNPNATEDNGIPTVNMELHSDEAILENAPKLNLNNTFITKALQIADKVLSNMDNPNWGIKNFNPLESLIHELHMHEMWEAVSRIYQQIKLSPPSDGVCDCITDVENNKILDMLRLIALRLREPELMYGGHKRSRQGKALQIEKPQYNFCCVGYRWRFKRDVENTSEVPEHEMKDSFLQDESNAMPKLTNEAAWEEWKKLMDKMTYEENYDLAMFLFCKLENN